MTNKENQGKKIYDKASKKWYAVSNEFYKAYDRMCNTTRKRMQYRKQCCCPRSKWWLCDAHCLDCEFYIAPSVSLDEPIILDDRSSDSTLGDYVSDPNTLTEKIAADRDLLLFLCARLKEIDPDAEKIIQIWKNYPAGISNRKIANMLGRSQRTFADEMKRFREKYRHFLND